MASFPLPLTHEEAMINFGSDQMMTSVVSIASHDELWNSQHERDSIGNFAIGSSYPQASCIQESEQFMEGIPLPLPSASISSLSLPTARYCTPENQAKFTSPFEYGKTRDPSNPSIIFNSSFENLSYSYECLPFDTSTRWINPHDIQERIPERNGVLSNLRPTGNSVNDWLVANQGGLTSVSPGISQFSNELSLRLATSQPHSVHGTSVPDQYSEMSPSSGFSADKRQSEHASCSNSNLSLSCNSYKPLQFSPLLSGSKFFHAVQEILAEIACYALENFDRMNYVSSGINHSFSPSSAAGRGVASSDIDFCVDNLMQERSAEAKKKHLISLLQVVDDRYNQCLDEIHTVVSAFHAVTELDPNLHARFALPSISFMYKNLRERISSHILAMGPQPREENAREEDDSFETSFIRKQWAVQQLKKKDNQFWRPQRGLPERSVSVLRAWMFQNFLHPYPKDAEKHLLALRSGLTRSQVSNWFINARVRLWKPMIEEMYAEMNRRKARRHEEETQGTHRNNMQFEDRIFKMN